MADRLPPEMYWSVDDAGVLTTEYFHETALAESPSCLGRCIVFAVVAGGAVVLALFALLYAVHPEMQVMVRRCCLGSG